MMTQQRLFTITYTMGIPHDFLGVIKKKKKKKKKTSFRRNRKKNAYPPPPWALKCSAMRGIGIGEMTS